MQVLRGHLLARVQHQKRDIGALYCFPRSHHTVLLDAALYSPAAPDSRGVDQDERIIPVQEARVHSVPSRARLFADNHPLLTENSIDQRGLTHVWSSNNGEAQLIDRTSDWRFRKQVNEAVQCFPQTKIMVSTDWYRLAEA